MNEKLHDKLDQLTIELKERRRNYHNSLRYVIYFCIIILVFFSLYSALISYKIREIATPSTVALLIAGELRDHFYDTLKDGKADFRRTAGDMSQSALLAVPVGIHAAGELIRESMDSDARSAALEISESLKQPLHRNIDRILADAAADTRTWKVPADIDLKELSRIGKRMMFPVPLALGEHLRSIRLKKKSALSRQDLCDRDFMLCWLFLVENERYHDTRKARFWLEFSATVARSWEDVMKQLADPGQNTTKNSPMRNRIPVRP